jgi:hypothetical protein
MDSLPPVDWRRFWVWIGLVCFLAIWIFSAVIEQGARLFFGIPSWVWPVALAVVAVESIALYHRRRMARIRGLELESEGWQRIRAHQNMGWWVCPYCRAAIPDIAGAWEDHIDPEYSACGAFTRKRDADERAARLGESAAPTTAEFVGVTGGRGGAGAIDSMSEGDE